MAAADWGGAKEAEVNNPQNWPLGSIPLVILSRTRPKNQWVRAPCSENGPLMAAADWGGAKEAEVNNPQNWPLGSIPLVTLSRSPKNQWVRRAPCSENGPLMATSDQGGTKEADKVKESRPLASISLATATLLAVLGSAALSVTSPGLAAAHRPARARSLTPGSTVSARQLAHLFLHPHRGVPQFSLVQPQEP